MSDERAVPVMAAFHEGLLAGRRPAEALAAASDAGQVDPTAAAFIALGA